MRVLNVAVLLAAVCGSSAACTSLLDLQEPPPGASDGGGLGDGTTPDGSQPDGNAPDGTAPDSTAPDAVASDGYAPDSSAPDGSAPDGSAPDANANEAGADTGGPTDASIEIPDGYTLISGTVTGLPAGASLTLQNDGGSNLTVQGDTDGGTSVAFAFPAPVADGSSYTITVSTQPSNALCTVAHGTGTAPGTSIDVDCGAVLQVATGFTTSCAIISGGAIDCWGDNAHGQLGNGVATNALADVPVRVTSLFGVTDIAVGQDHACALEAGVVYCWGYNASGQLGTGSNNQETTPTRVTLPSLAVAITASYQHTCALLSTGGVECWGDNVDGDLGNGLTTASNAPVVVNAVGGGGALTNVIAIDAGTSHTCALLSSGTVVCWGNNANEQLGNGTTTTSTVPVVSSVTNAIAISAGSQHTCAILGTADAAASGGSVTCWGADNNGQTSSASLSGTTGPALVPLSRAATGITGGGNFTCALLVDDSVECWGENISGQLGGTPLTAAQHVPQPITQLSGVANVAAGDQHACAVLSSGGIECWGANAWGQIGSGASTFPTPAAIAGLTTVRSLGLGSPANHACAVLDGGTVACWGTNIDGQLANGNQLPSNVPVAIPGVTGAIAVAVGGDHSCALIDGGTAECWGFGGDGQLGNGSNTGLVPTPAPVMGLTGAVAIGAGQNYTCALTSTGTVECWGVNAQGELGNGSFTNANTPGSVVGLTGVTAISAGSFHVCAVLSDGGVDCWGENNNGQLGVTLDGGTVNEPNVVAVPGVSGVVGVTAGADHTCALMGDGGVDCWGANASGQLGIGTTTNSVSTPTPVVGLTGAAIQIAAGAGHTCALMASGGIECWGGERAGRAHDRERRALRSHDDDGGGHPGGDRGDRGLRRAELDLRAALGRHGPVLGVERLRSARHRRTVAVEHARPGSVAPGRQRPRRRERAAALMLE